MALLAVAPRAFAEMVPIRSEKLGILDRFLGEELTYRIGFWLLARCGEARIQLKPSPEKNVYQAGLEGWTVGWVDWLLGHYRYAYLSDLEVSPDGDRFRPRRFRMIRKMGNREFLRSVVFDHAGGEIRFSKTHANGETQKKTLPMRPGVLYEDYLTLFYNFRHGCYGSPAPGRTYRIPLPANEKLTTLRLSVASPEETAAERRAEREKEGKDYLLQFDVNPGDVSSRSGSVRAWLSQDFVPVKGTIKNVIFFGDLWGQLIHCRRPSDTAPGNIE